MLPNDFDPIKHHCFLNLSGHCKGSVGLRRPFVWKYRERAVSGKFHQLPHGLQLFGQGRFQMHLLSRQGVTHL